MDYLNGYSIVTVIVHAKDEEEALSKGKEAIDRIAAETESICLTFDCKEDLDIWEIEQNLPPVLLASSPKGMQLIEEGMQFMVDTFMDALERIKLAIQYFTPEQIMECESPENLPQEIKEKIEPDFIREDFEEVGGQRKDILKHLYFYSDPITSKVYLSFALENIMEGLTAYVIPAACPNP